MNSLAFELGVDKIHQENKIIEVTKALGHKPHEIFLLLKFKTTKNGEKIAERLTKLIKDVLELIEGVAPELKGIL